MATQLFSNNAESTLASGVSSSATSIILQTGDGNGKGFPSPSGGNFFLLTLCQRNGATEANWEIVKVTARNGDVLTVERGQEGTTAQVHNSGEIASCRLTAGSMNTDAIAEAGTNKYFTNSRVLGAVLTGLSVASSQVVVATDTVLAAIGYLQKQITDVNAAVGTKLSSAGGLLTGVITFLSTRGTKGAITSNNIDLLSGDYFSRTISGATTFTVSNVAATGLVSAFILSITNGGSAAITWWSGIKWPGGSPPMLTTTGRDRLGFMSEDGGVTWDGFVLGKDLK